MAVTEHQQIGMTRIPATVRRLLVDLRDASRYEVDRQREERRRSHNPTLTRNLSRRSHSWVRVAAMVVSEINDRLSPKKAPPTTIAREPRLVQSGFRRQTRRNGNQRHDRPDRSSDREGRRSRPPGRAPREAGSGQKVECQGHGGIHGTHALGRFGEGPGQHEDPDHQQDIWIRSPAEKCLMRSAKGMRRIVATA